MDYSKVKHISELGKSPNSENKQLLLAKDSKKLTRINSDQFIAGIKDKLVTPNTFPVTDKYTIQNVDDSLHSETINNQFIFGYGFEKGAIDPRDYQRISDDTFRTYGWDKINGRNQFELKLKYGYGFTTELMRVKSNRELIKKIKFVLKSDAKINISICRFNDVYIPLPGWQENSKGLFETRRVIFSDYPGVAGSNEIIITDEFDFIFQIYNNEYIVIESSDETNEAILLGYDYETTYSYMFIDCGLISYNGERDIEYPYGERDLKRMAFYAETVYKDITHDYTPHNIDLNATYVDGINKIYNNGGIVNRPISTGKILDGSKYTKFEGPEYADVCIKVNNGLDGFKVDRVKCLVPDGKDQLAMYFSFFAYDPANNIVYDDVFNTSHSALCSPPDDINTIAFGVSQNSEMIYPAGFEYWVKLTNANFQWIDTTSNERLTKITTQWNEETQKYEGTMTEFMNGSVPIIFELSNAIVSDVYDQIKKIPVIDKNLTKSGIDLDNMNIGMVSNSEFLKDIEESFIFVDTEKGKVKLIPNQDGSLSWEPVV